MLTTALEVRSLSPAEAESGVPVKLRGVVVFIEGKSASFFLQDETSTTFFRLPPLAQRKSPAPEIGDEIEITSKTRMGLYLPGVDHVTFRVLGRRALPPGIPVRYDDLYFARYHYQRVAVEGVVRSVQPLGAEKSLIRLAMGSRVIEARVEVPPQPGRSLVDHRVRITGLAAGLINMPRRQLVQPYLRVIDWSEVHVLEPAPPATDLPEVSAEELLAFRVSGYGQERVRIGGVVTAAFPEYVFLREGSSAFSVRLVTPASLDPGDEVTVVGFPAMERFSASVVDAELVARAPGAAPAPAPVEVASLEDLFDSQQAGQYDGDLVRVTVTARESFKTKVGTALLVQDRERTIQVQLPASIAVPSAGSRVRLTGIFQVESAAFANSGFGSLPSIVSLRARSAGDIEVLQTPPWWTPRRLSAVLAALAGVTLLAGLWIAVLRRQVARQTAALRHRIESEAALEERQRIAREFHDTLEQELAGVSLRLDALATREIDAKGAHLVAASRSLVSRIQSETRELISDLRNPEETAGDLTAALTLLAARQSADTGIEIRVAARDAIPRLAAATVHDLRMIARESINNALKHGRATQIVIVLEMHSEQLVIRVVDNGSGFDVAMATSGKRGHFGCAGMRERARKIGATITWQTTPQNGAAVEVVLPWQPRATAPSDAASPTAGYNGVGTAPLVGPEAVSASRRLAALPPRAPFPSGNGTPPNGGPAAN